MSAGIIISFNFAPGLGPMKLPQVNHIAGGKSQVKITKAAPKVLFRGSIRIEIHMNCQAAGEAAAKAAAETIRVRVGENSPLSVVFATGASQLDTLQALTQIPGVPWEQVSGFHMDEYLGIPPDHPASFRRYLRENLTQKVHLREFHEIDGTAVNPEDTCRKYGDLLRSARPQLCLLGIGENGHLAFNDPADANFWDPQDAKVVTLDAVCRRQQVAEGWFQSLEEVPSQAITLTIPVLMRIPKLIVSVPGWRKAQIVHRTLAGSISADCPASILRTHPDATIYLDAESATEIENLK